MRVVHQNPWLGDIERTFYRRSAEPFSSNRGHIAEEIEKRLMEQRGGKGTVALTEPSVHLEKDVGFIRKLSDLAIKGDMGAQKVFSAHRFLGDVEGALERTKQTISELNKRKANTVHDRALLRFGKQQIKQMVPSLANKFFESLMQCPPRPGPGWNR